MVQKSVEVPVRGGENNGETLTYTNIVHELTPVGLWNGRPSTIRLAMTWSCDPRARILSCWIQEADAGPTHRRRETDDGSPLSPLRFLLHGERGAIHTSSALP